MSIQEKQIGSVTVVTVRGNLMGGNGTQAVRNKIKMYIEDGCKMIVVDLSKVKWLNSQGLGMLMACLTTIRNNGGDLKITGATERVQNVFMVTKLVRVFETYDTVREAVESFTELVHA